MSENTNLQDKNEYNEVEDPKASVITYNIGKGGQVNINYGDGNLTAEQNNKCCNCDHKIIKKVTIVNNVNNVSNVQQTNKASSSSQSNDTVAIALFIAMIATGFFIEYKREIQLGLLIATIAIELITIVTYYTGKRNDIYFDNNFKKVMGFNAVSVFMVPVLMWLIDKPFFFKGIEYSVLKQQMKNEGLISTLFNASAGTSVMYQMAGVILSGIFLIFIIVSELYIIAVINVVKGSKIQSFWMLVLRKTCGSTKNGTLHIVFGLFILIICFTMITGILPNVLKLI